MGTFCQNFNLNDFEAKWQLKAEALISLNVTEFEILQLMTNRYYIPQFLQNSSALNNNMLTAPHIFFFILLQDWVILLKVSRKKVKCHGDKIAKLPQMRAPDWKVVLTDYLLMTYIGTYKSC